MSNTKYDEGRAATANSDVDYDTDTFTLIALSSAYTFDATDAFADLPAALDTATLANTVVASDGWVTSDPAVFTGLAIGEDTASFVLRDTTAGVLVAYYDLATGGVPVDIEGDGTNVTITPSVDGWLRI